MIDKRLLKLVPSSKIYTIKLLSMKLLSLFFNVAIIYNLINLIFYKKGLAFIIVFIVLKSLSLYLTQKIAADYSVEVKKTLREKIFTQLFKVEGNYKDALSTSELVQVSLEGVSQLDAYYHLYIPQFFYSLIAPLILFVILSRYHLMVALMLLIAVPLIPISIIMVQKFAKKLLSKYWGQYTELGDTFLDRLQGLLPLKIYQAEARTLEEIDQQALAFRSVTMRVLMMQLNSISMMDLVAYGGSALAMVVSIFAYQKGQIQVSEMVFIILLSADYFIPMRQLGSYFHLSMNGVAASDRIHNFLALDVDNKKVLNLKSAEKLCLTDVTISYPDRPHVVKDVSMTIDKGTYHVIVGESGSGKSSVAKAMLQQIDYEGTISLDNHTLANQDFSSLVLGQLGFSELFNASLYENMCLGFKHSKASCQKVLNSLDLSHLNLDDEIYERGANLSGGEKQRIVFSRMLLNQRDFYIFDEVTSNVDVESEQIIMSHIQKLIERGSAVIFITHRLKNAHDADLIHVFEKGRIVEQGTHQELMKHPSSYANLYNKQKEVESVGA